MSDGRDVQCLMVEMCRDEQAVSDGRDVQCQMSKQCLMVEMCSVR